MTNTELARLVLVTADEGVGQQVAQFVAEGMTEAAATERALAALMAHAEGVLAEQAFLASLV